MTPQSSKKEEINLSETFLDTDGRFYPIEIDGEIRNFVSVTTVLDMVRMKGFLDKWEHEMLELLGVDGLRKYMHKKAAEGTELHGLIEQYLGNPEKVIDFQEDCSSRYVWKKFLNWVEWWNSYEKKPTILGMENKIFSKKYGFAGRLDCLADDGSLILFDWKSGKSKESYKMQVSAYAKAYEEMHPQSHIKEAKIITLGEDTQKGWRETIVSGEKKHKNSSVEETEIEYYFRGFLTFKKCIDWSMPSFGPNHLELPRYVVPTLV